MRKDGKTNKDGVCKPNALLSSSHTIGKAYPVKLKGTTKKAEDFQEGVIFFGLVLFFV